MDRMQKTQREEDLLGFTRLRKFVLILSFAPQERGQA